MNASTVRQRHYARLPEEPMRSCGCEGPIVAVLTLDGSECGVCEECVAANSNLVQVADATTDARGVAILNA